VATGCLFDQDMLESTLLIATAANQNSPKLDYCDKNMTPVRRYWDLKIH